MKKAEFDLSYSGEITENPKTEDSHDEQGSNSGQLAQPPHSEERKTNKWTIKEDEALNELVQNFGEKNWRKISSMMQGRSAIQCLHRWSKILKPGLVKGPWTAEEDEKLVHWVEQNGPLKWSQCSELITGRSGKQCRERWFNNLNPNVKKGNWTPQEDEVIFKGYFKHGSSWSRIAKDLEGRTENSVKNRFYSTVRKLLSDMEKKGPAVSGENENYIKIIMQQTIGEKTLDEEGKKKQLQDSIKRELEKEVKSETSKGSKNSDFDKKNKREDCPLYKKLKIEEDSRSVNMEEDRNQEFKEVIKKIEELNKKKLIEENIQMPKLEVKPIIQQSQKRNSKDKDKKNHDTDSSQKSSEDYSQQNCLYRLILQGNVSIKRTIAMRDYSLYQKNKVRSNSKKASKSGQENEKKDEDQTKYQEKILNCDKKEDQSFKQLDKKNFLEILKGKDQIENSDSSEEDENDIELDEDESDSESDGRDLSYSVSEVMSGKLLKHFSSSFMKVVKQLIYKNSKQIKEEVNSQESNSEEVIDIKRKRNEIRDSPEDFEPNQKKFLKMEETEADSQFGQKNLKKSQKTEKDKKKRNEFQDNESNYNQQKTPLCNQIIEEVQEKETNNNNNDQISIENQLMKQEELQNKQVTKQKKGLYSNFKKEKLTRSNSGISLQNNEDNQSSKIKTRSFPSDEQLDPKKKLKKQQQITLPSQESNQQMKDMQSQKLSNNALQVVQYPEKKQTINILPNQIQIHPNQFYLEPINTLSTEQNPKLIGEDRKEDRIDYLIFQLQSLQNMLNTTKNELSKLEYSIKETPLSTPKQDFLQINQDDLIFGFDDSQYLNNNHNQLSLNSNSPLKMNSLQIPLSPSHNNCLNELQKSQNNLMDNQIPSLLQYQGGGGGGGGEVNPFDEINENNLQHSLHYLQDDNEVYIKKEENSQIIEDSQKIDPKVQEEKANKFIAETRNAVINDPFFNENIGSFNCLLEQNNIQQ